MPGRRPLWRRIIDAFIHPEQWDLTPEPPSPPPPPAKRPAKKATPPAKRAPAKKVAPHSRPVRTRVTPRNQLPAAWGPNKVAYWQEATRSMPLAAATDWKAQAYYDAALYSFSETHEVRAAILEQLFRYIEETYGVDFRKVFDWAGYRENYDTVAIQHGGDFAEGGELDV